MSELVKEECISLENKLLSLFPKYKLEELRKSREACLVSYSSELEAYNIYRKILVEGIGLLNENSYVRKTN